MLDFEKGKNKLKKMKNVASVYKKSLLGKMHKKRAKKLLQLTNRSTYSQFINMRKTLQKETVLL